MQKALLKKYNHNLGTEKKASLGQAQFGDGGKSKFGTDKKLFICPKLAFSSVPKLLHYIFAFLDMFSNIPTQDKSISKADPP